MRELAFLLLLIPAAPADDALEPWASDRHPTDVPRRHVQELGSGHAEYRIVHGGTMDGLTCRSPIGGGFGIWQQSWESNRAVRLENIGETDVLHPWLSNGRNDFRSPKEIVAGAVTPGMSDRERAIAIWRRQTTQRFHAGADDSAEMHDPVKVFNVYGYTTCGDDSICLAGLWHAAGFSVSPGRLLGHRTSQVFFDGRWNFLDGDLGPLYLLRDNATIASELDLVRDHDLLKRSHPYGVLDPDRRRENEGNAALYTDEGELRADRGIAEIARNSTMNMVLRPGEAIVWRWGHTVPVKYHGVSDIKIFGPRSEAGRKWGASAADRICNGRWEYQPDFARELWRKGAESVEHVAVDGGALVAEEGKVGTIVWKLQSPYVFVGGSIAATGRGARFSISWDGVAWQPAGENLDPQFPSQGPARYQYRLKCELPAGARLERLAVFNDLQMAPLALPGVVLGENRFTYTDQSTGPRRVRITHDWVERSLHRPPAAPAAVVSPADGAAAEASDAVFEWRPAEAADGDAVADYHFVLSDRADLAWPLSSNFEKLLSNTSERGRASYRPPGVGLLTPGRKYYWHVRACSDKGVWGPWSRTWCFTPGGPAAPLDVRLDGDDGRLVLRWKPNPAGQAPARYRIYGSDERGFSISDTAYEIDVGVSKDLSRRRPANFVAETERAELAVLGADLDLPNANQAFYRVVAVDGKGTRSGPSDAAAAPRPFITAKPGITARRGTAYQGRLSTLRSLGDLRLQWVDENAVASFWDIERPRYTLREGPAWLRIDERSGLLSGVPDAAGPVEVAVQVALERSRRVLHDGGPRPWNLGFGKEKTRDVVTETVGETTYRFRITVSD
ncbi:MAG TPA: hypothetical protein VNM14_25050 [Planctomycetota bacterium]|nr:hypothetical protein [Planctomycetota bacterium]